jgi:hypothetical protein
MSQMSAASIALIEASSGELSWRQRRVQVFDLPEGRVIVKGQRAKRGPWKHRLLRWVAGVLGVPMMRPVTVPGGAQSQALELTRLQALRAAGARVPQVLHVAPEYFVMTHLGHTDMAWELRERGPEVFGLWQQAAEQIIAVHAAGQYLSQCFSRNIILAGEGQQRHVAGLIDFEDDPASVMSVQDAQVRDWLVFLQSTLFTLAVPAAQLQPVLTDILNAEQAPVRDALLAQARRTAWLRHLPTSRKTWGKDFVNVQAIAAALYEQLKLRQLI